MNNESTQYGGFWRRFAALWLDFLILLPISLFTFWGGEQFRLFSIYFLVPSIFFGLFYGVYLVRRFGGTPGKLIMGLCIRKVSLEPIGYREAFLRYAPELLLSILISIALIQPLLQMTDSQYHALSFMERSKYLVDNGPAWFKPIEITQQIWIWGEFVVMLTNRKRRALHDFIAGTVVIRRQTEQDAAANP